MRQIYRAFSSGWQLCRQVGTYLFGLNMAKPLGLGPNFLLDHVVPSWKQHQYFLWPFKVKISWLKIMIKVSKSGIPQFSFYKVTDFQPFVMLVEDS